MCEKHIKLFFCVHRREADNPLFVFILTEGSAAFAYDIIKSDAISIAEFIGVAAKLMP